MLVSSCCLQHTPQKRIRSRALSLAALNGHSVCIDMLLLWSCARDPSESAVQSVLDTMKRKEYRSLGSLFSSAEIDVGTGEEESEKLPSNTLHGANVSKMEEEGPQMTAVVSDDVELSPVRPQPLAPPRSSSAAEMGDSVDPISLFQPTSSFINVDHRDSQGMTPVMCAAYSGNSPLVARLCEVCITENKKQEDDLF